MSVRGRVAGAEEDFTIPELIAHVVDWPQDDGRGP
jgi:hypothetical protein